MPGIVGFTRAHESDDSAIRLLRKMQGLISHFPSYKKESLFCDGNVCATRSHLNIGQRTPQPEIKSGVYLWIDGEIFSSSTLPRESGRGPVYETENLSALYRLNGDLSLLKNINGNYAAVIYDSGKRLVHLISDRYGSQHLYWTSRGNSLTWSSEIKAILSRPSVSPAISPGAVKQFMEIGYFLEDRTWFEGIHLLPPGTVLTWNLQTNSASSRRYWWWDDIKPANSNIDDTESADETGRLLNRALECQSRASGRVGLFLSGGLDSRAILAACPPANAPAGAITFGKRDSDEITIASIVARRKGVPHHVVELDRSNWLGPRIAGVWYTDGEFDLMHMHGIEAIPRAVELFEVSLNGYAGDLILGGTFLRGKSTCDLPINKLLACRIMHCSPDSIDIPKDYFNLRKSDYYFLDNRVRRFTWGGTRCLGTRVEVRRPFLDNALVEFVYSLPDRKRYRQRLYHLMLLRCYPTLFNDIPWQRTGVPINTPMLIAKSAERLLNVRSSFLRKLSSLGLPFNDRHTYADYPGWIRQAPALSFFNEILCAPDALSRAYISQREIEATLEKHIRGTDCSNRLCRCLTFELFLQQTFEGKFIPSNIA